MATITVHSRQISIQPSSAVRHRRRRLPSAVFRTTASASASLPPPPSPPSLAVDRQGGRMVAELVGAFNEITERMGSLHNTSPSSQLLFKSLKLSIPLLQSMDFAPDGRSRLSRALSVASLLADLQMDAEVISAGILRETLESGALTMQLIKAQIGAGPAYLLHESLRINRAPAKLIDILDEESASSLRKFCLTFYDIRALILELALKLDSMRHLSYLPKCHQLIKSLEVMKIFAPLAHAVGAGNLCLELEDLSFKYLFPYSYNYIDNWLTNHESGSKLLIENTKEHLVDALNADSELRKTVDRVLIQGRYKSRFSTMKKNLKDGRKPEEVNDILGLRVILEMKNEEFGPRACYRTREVITSLWREVSRRSKDYIERPKRNGYRSLHVAVDVSGDDVAKSQPLMEIQIRTAEMHRQAAGGTASHSLYKGGLTDPGEAKRLKAIMMAAAELAALRLRDLPEGGAHRNGLVRNGVFSLLDKNRDGRISVEELTEVMEDLGANIEDAKELMHLLDANSDGSVSSEEFDLFQRQVQVMRNLEDRDDEYSTILKEKLEMIDNTGLIQVYRKELGDKLILSQ